MSNWIAKRPWLLVLVAFFILISVWGFRVWLSTQYPMEEVPLAPRPTQQTSREGP